MHMTYHKQHPIDDLQYMYTRKFTKDNMQNLLFIHETYDTICVFAVH